MPKAFYSLNKIQGRDKAAFLFNILLQRLAVRLKSVCSKNYDTVAAVAFAVAGT